MSNNKVKVYPSFEDINHQDEVFESIEYIKEGGFCNMFDRGCINRHLEADGENPISREQLMDWMKSYDEK